MSHSTGSGPTHSTGSAPGDDAQRTLEQRALRNVRGLLDKIEDKEEEDRKALRKQVVVVGAIAAACIALFVAVGLFSKQSEGPKTIIIPPPAKAQK